MLKKFRVKQSEFLILYIRALKKLARPSPVGEGVGGARGLWG